MISKCTASRPVKTYHEKLISYTVIPNYITLSLFTDWLVLSVNKARSKSTEPLLYQNHHHHHHF